jgi:hypothetical protein
MRAQETVVVGAVVFGAAVLALVLWSAATAGIIDRLPASHWMTVERLDTLPWWWLMCKGFTFGVNSGRPMLRNTFVTVSTCITAR